jgi:predicted ATPase/DNA-binding winged helix-turn-helix (wHTH) protein
VVTEFGAYRLDRQRRTLEGPDGPVHLQRQVFDVLFHLVANRERVVPKEELLDEVWGDRFVSESAMTSRIKAARRAIGDDGRAQRCIRTVHGVGYQFVAQVAGDDAAGGPPAPTDPVRGLPSPRTRLIGRDRELAELGAQLGSGRLISVVGPGGVGKTALALAAARAWCERAGAPGVWADLTATRAAEDVLRAVAEAAGVEGEAAGSVDLLAANLAGRPVLVVLDNCEHVLRAAAGLAERIVAGGGSAGVLATSREPLGVYEEQLWPLDPLAEAAAELFVERARSAEPRVAWDPEDAAVAALCARLDGLPLAVELAAGQLRRWDLAELVRRLERSLGPLASGTSRPDARHHTMAAAIGWSHQLLEPAEQALLRHLGVFPSWFDLPTAEAMAPLLPDVGVADTLADLVDRSLVVRDPHAGRYRLLETIRLFATERLADAGESEAAREQHRRHVVAVASEQPRVDRWLSARLAADHHRRLDDARQAFWASLAAGAPGDALEIAVASTFLWRNARGGSEGATWLAALGRVAGELGTDDQRWLRILEADLAQGAGDFGAMITAAEAALAIGGARDAATTIAEHYRCLLVVTDPDRGRPAFEAVLAEAGDPRLADLVRAFVVVADLGVLAAGRPVDLDDVGRRLARLDAGASEDGYERFIVHWVGWMVGLARQDAESARRWFAAQQDYLLRTGMGDTWITTYSSALADAIDGDDIRGRLRRASALAEQEGYRVAGDCLLALAYSLACQGEPVRAAELLGASVAGRFNATAHALLHQVVIDPVIRRALAADEFAAAFQRGRAADPVEVLDELGIGPMAPP